MKPTIIRERDLRVGDVVVAWRGTARKPVDRRELVVLDPNLSTDNEWGLAGVLVMNVKSGTKQSFDFGGYTIKRVSRLSAEDLRALGPQTRRNPRPKVTIEL